MPVCRHSWKLLAPACRQESSLAQELSPVPSLALVSWAFLHLVLLQVGRGHWVWVSPKLDGTRQLMSSSVDKEVPVVRKEDPDVL